MFINESLNTAIAAVKLLKWKKKISNFNYNYRPKVNNPKFMCARDAVALIPDNACLMGMGMTVSARPAILWSAIGDRYKKTGSPKNLTNIAKTILAEETSDPASSSPLHQHEGQGIHVSHLRIGTSPVPQQDTSPCYF